MGRPERNGVCTTCGGRIRHYPGPTAATARFSQWVHLDRDDWINDRHAPEPTPESLAAAGLLPVRS